MFLPWSRWRPTCWVLTTDMSVAQIPQHLPRPHHPNIDSHMLRADRRFYARNPQVSPFHDAGQESSAPRLRRVALKGGRVLELRVSG